MNQSRLILPNDFIRGNGPEPLTLKQELHKRIKFAITVGRAPWEIPVAYDPNCGLQHNVRTGGRYRGINTLLLCDTYHTDGYRSKWWGTEENWNTIGATIQRDEEPTLIAHYLGDGMAIEERHVYNVHQVHGADHLRPTIKEVAASPAKWVMKSLPSNST